MTRSLLDLLAFAVCFYRSLSVVVTVGSNTFLFPLFTNCACHLHSYVKRFLPFKRRPAAGVLFSSSAPASLYFSQLARSFVTNKLERQATLASRLATRSPSISFRFNNGARAKFGLDPTVDIKVIPQRPQK